MASITRCGTCVPPGPSRNAAGCPLTVCAREGNWARTQGRSRAASGTVSVVGMAAIVFSARRQWTGAKEQVAGGTLALLKALRERLAHHRGVFGLHLVNEAHFAGLAVGIFVDAEIFLGQLVDAGAGALFGDLH